MQNKNPKISEIKQNIRILSGIHSDIELRIKGKKRIIKREKQEIKKSANEGFICVGAINNLSNLHELGNKINLPEIEMENLFFSIVDNLGNRMIQIKNICESKDVDADLIRKHLNSFEVSLSDISKLYKI